MASKKHFTAMGEQIDMSALALRHANTIALGNASMNARGDIIGSGGTVLRTQEQIDEEWRRAKEMRDASVGGISPNLKEPLPKQMVGTKMVDVNDMDFNPEPAAGPTESAPATSTNGEAVMGLVEKQQTRRRKIVDTD